MRNLKNDIRGKISEIIEKIDNEEYLELIRRFAEKLLDGRHERNYGNEERDVCNGDYRKYKKTAEYLEDRSNCEHCAEYHPVDSLRNSPAWAGGWCCQPGTWLVSGA